MHCQVEDRCLAKQWLNKGVAEEKEMATMLICVMKGKEESEMGETDTEVGVKG